MRQTSNNHADPKEAFQRLGKKALAIGITAQQLAELEAVKHLKAPNKTWHRAKSHLQRAGYLMWPLLVSIVCIAGMLFLTWLTEWPVTHERMAEIWFDALDRDIDREACLVEVPEFIQDYTRPPVDCFVCNGIRRIEKVSKITPEEFEQKYAYSGKPVVITDATSNWTATEHFSFDFFKSIYSQDSPALENSDVNCQFFPYKTDFSNLGEVFNMSEDRAHLKDLSKPWYIGWSNCDSTAANLLRQHYQRPYFLPRVAECSRTDWIFMGSPGYGAHMHIDNVGDPSWQAQIKGKKQWTLKPPPECYYICENKMEVVVNPGEIIVVDTNRWYHSTLILGNELSIVITTEYD